MEEPLGPADLPVEEDRLAEDLDPLPEEDQAPDQAPDPGLDQARGLDLGAADREAVGQDRDPGAEDRDPGAAAA